MYLLFATLSYVLVSLMIEILMSGQPGFTTFAGFHWFLNPTILTANHMLLWFLQGLGLSFAGYLYINKFTPLFDGVRFGLITGLLFVLMMLFNMMVHLDEVSYHFFADALLPLTGLYLLGFAISGWFFGLMYEAFGPRMTDIRTQWTLA